MKNELELKLKKLFKTKERPQVRVILNEYGDLASNVLFIAAKENKKEPKKIWDEFKDEVEKRLAKNFEKIEFVNGYLNFHLKKDLLFKTFKIAVKKPKQISLSNFGHKQKVIVEFLSANPTGPLHLGNGRNAVLGEVISRVLKKTGFSVFKEYYNNNRGRQIKILGLSALSFLKLPTENENELYKGKYLEELVNKNKGLCFKFKDQPEYLGYLLSKKILEFYIKPTLKSLGIKFDNFFSERSLYSSLDKEVLQKIKRHTYKKDGALWLKLETKDEVLIKSDGEPTYFLSDIIYHYHKFVKRNFKYGINILGADHLDHGRRLKEALKILGIKENKLKFIIYQLVYVKKFEKILKMSKRKGDIIFLDDLIKEVGPDPIKFYFVFHPPETHLTFDLELAKKKTEENLYWYVVYTGARLESILKKFGKISKKEIDVKKCWEIFKDNKQFIEILKRIYFWKEILIEVAKSLQVQILPQYIVETCKKINNFYESEKIIEKDRSKTYQKLPAIIALVNFLKEAFDTLNIEFKEKV